MKNQYGFQRYMFDKGKFYFDGEFNIVEFVPKDIKLYHGSVSLCLRNLEFPMKDFYKSGDHLKNKDKEILKDKEEEDEKKREIIYKRLKPSHIWLGGETCTANYYSWGMDKNTKKELGKNFDCYKFCIHAYKPKKTLKFIDMSDIFNMMVITKYKNKELTKEELKDLKNDYKIIEEIKKQNKKYYKRYHPFERVIGKIAIGDSTRRGNGYSKTAEGLIKLTKKYGYDGYAFPKMGKKGNGEKYGYKFSEYVIANPLKSIERDYENKKDWQYQGVIRNKDIEQLYKMMKEYKTTNVDFHAGNLLEHSIWSGLNMEEWIKEENEWCKDIKTEDKKISIFCAFIHDIGKVQEKQLYYDINRHPHNGRNLLINEKEIFMNNKKEKKINFKKVFENEGFTEEEIKLAAFICELHWEFGNCIKLGKDGKEYVKLCEKEYKKLGIKKRDLKTCINILIAVSCADIKSMKQYINKTSLKKRINHKSEYFSWMKNRSASWPGKDGYKEFEIEKYGKPLRRRIMKMI